jgi:hypothetical protein
MPFSSLGYTYFGYEVQFSETACLAQGKQFFSAAKAGLSQASSFSSRSNKCKSQKAVVKSDVVCVALSSIS